jgi:hypothetical protein
MAANIIKVTYINYVASSGELRKKIEHYPIEKDEIYYKDRLSNEPELWEIVDVNSDPNGVFILVPYGFIADGEDLLETYLSNKYKGWDLKGENNG